MMDLKSSCLFFVLAGMTWQSGDSLATMSIDLSSEFLKIAIVKPGVPMEIVLNTESQRKTPLAVSIRNGERTFAEAALATCGRHPKNCFTFFLDLLGKNSTHPLVKLYQERFPQHDLVDDSSSRRIVFRLDSDTQFSPEELLGMVIKYSRSLAEKYAEHPISEAVITVPPYFTQIERLAVEYAAKLAGVKILQLLNDNTAAAVNYGVFRRKEMNSTMNHIMIFDMGSSGSTATIVGYQITKPKEGGESSVLHVKGVGYDRTLGGLEIDLRLRKLFIQKFSEKSKKDASKNPQALMKLLKEAARVKKVLSANTEHMAQLFRSRIDLTQYQEQLLEARLLWGPSPRVEGLMDDVDFSTKLQRSDLESICQDVFDRIPRVVEQALQAANMGVEELQQIIIIGGGTRIPKVQEKLLAVVKRSELGKNLNSDEAIALGAVYQAAHLSKGFKVKQFDVTDATLIPIGVEFERGSKDSAEKSGDSPSKTIKRVLFGRSNGFPQRKVLTFPKHTTDFKFAVRYADFDFLPPLEQSYLSNNLDFEVELKGVTEAFEKNQDKRPKGVKAHFKLDHSGIFGLDYAEAIFEFEKEQEVPSTMEKIGQSITNFFSGSSSNASDNATQPEQPSSDINASTGSESATNTSDKPAEDVSKVFTTTLVNKTQTVKEKLKETVSRLDAAEYPEKDFTAAKKRLVAMDEKDREKSEREKSRNVLETYIFDIQDKLYQPAYEKVSTEGEREGILKSFREASEWLEEEASIQGASVYKSKLKSLEGSMKDIVERLTESNKRPAAITDLDKSIKLIQTFHEFMTNGSAEGIFTDVEVSGLQKLIKDTQEWRATNTKLQEKSPLTSAPVLRVADVIEKQKALDRELSYLLNKVKIAKTKAKAEKTSKNQTADEKSDNSTAGDENVTEPAVEAEEENAAEKDAPQESPDNSVKDDAETDVDDNQETLSSDAEPEDKPRSKAGKKSTTHSPEL